SARDSTRARERRLERRRDATTRCQQGRRRSRTRLPDRSLEHVNWGGRKKPLEVTVGTEVRHRSSPPWPPVPPCPRVTAYLSFSPAGIATANRFSFGGTGQMYDGL